MEEVTVTFDASVTGHRRGRVVILSLSLSLSLGSLSAEEELQVFIARHLGGPQCRLVYVAQRDALYPTG